MYNLTIYVIYNAQLFRIKENLLYSIYTSFTLCTYFLHHVSQFFFLQEHDSLFNPTIKNTRTIYFTATHTVPHLSFPATQFLLTIQLAQTRLRFQISRLLFSPRSPWGNLFSGCGLRVPVTLSCVVGSSSDL